MKKNFLTLFLIVVNISVFLVMVFSGVKIWNPGVNDLIKYGANFNALVYSGEYFRLISCQFVHAGIIHLIVNMTALYSLGSFLEERLGKFSFLSVYFLSGIAAALLSASWHSFIVSTGASGAIMGLAGAELTLIIKDTLNDRLKPGLLLKAFTVILINLFLGFIISFIDNAAHIGGLLFGFGFTFILYGNDYFENHSRITKQILPVLVSLILLFLWAFNLPSASYRYYAVFNKFINYEQAVHNQSEGKGYMETEKYIQQLTEIKSTWVECNLMLDTIYDLPDDLNDDIRILQKYSYYKAEALDQYIKALSEEEYQLLDSMEFTNALLAFLPKVKHGIMPDPGKKDSSEEKSNLKNIKIFYDENWKETDSISAVYFREAQVDSLNRVNGMVSDYYKNGRIQMKGYYLNDLKNDIFRYYYPDGNYESMGKYVFDQPGGRWKNFYPNGQLKEEILYTDESALLKNFWDSSGIQLIYNGNGIYMIYNQDGSLQDSGMYLDGLKSGIWCGYYSADHRYYKENYLNGTLLLGVSYSLDNEIFQYKSIYVPPEPIGGMKNYLEYIEKNLVYPGPASGSRIEGTLLIDVTVDTTGTVISIENINKLGFGCDEEAKRLIREGNSFSPARERGQIIQAVKRINVKFDLSRE